MSFHCACGNALTLTIKHSHEFYCWFFVLMANAMCKKIIIETHNSCQFLNILMWPFVFFISKITPQKIIILHFLGWIEDICIIYHSSDTTSPSPSTVFVSVTLLPLWWQIGRCRQVSDSGIWLHLYALCCVPDTACRVTTWLHHPQAEQHSD